MSKFDGVNAVVWVATTRPSTDSVAWWLTAPNSIQADCGCPESGTVTLREYTASFTSVKPCLYQPPPGTAIVVAARPAGVKPQVPLTPTEAPAAFPAATPSAPAAATAPVEPGAARAGPWTARVRPPRTTAAASPPAAAGNQPRRRAFERCMPTSCDSSASSQQRSGRSLKADARTDSTDLPAPPATRKGGGGSDRWVSNPLIALACLRH